MSQGLGGKNKINKQNKNESLPSLGVKGETTVRLCPIPRCALLMLPEGRCEWGVLCLFFKKWENHMWFHLTDWTKLNTKLQNITKIIKISEYYADYIYIYIYDWHWNCNYITIFTVEDVQMLRLCIYCTLCLVGWVAERDGRIQEWFPVPFSDADGQSRKVSETRFMQEKGLLHFC